MKLNLFRPEWQEILTASKNKAYLIEDGYNNDISLANIHLPSLCKKLHIPVTNTTESHITLKKGKPIGQVTELKECSENINAKTNYDLSDNNLQCRQTLKSDEKEHLRNIVLDYKMEIKQKSANLAKFRSSIR